MHIYIFLHNLDFQYNLSILFYGFGFTFENRIELVIGATPSGES